MNKIIIDREEFAIDNFSGEMEINVNKLELTIKGHVSLKEWIKESRNLDLIVNIEDNAVLEYNRFGIIKDNNTKIVINQNNNSRLNFKESFIVNSDTNLKIENNILGNNNISEVVVRLTSRNESKVVVDATLDVQKDTIDNELKEDLRGLETDNSKITIIPNMLVSSSEVIANHNVTIGNVSDEDLFYLTSKGLSKDEARKLLETGFLISIFEDNDYKTKIKEIIK